MEVRALPQMGESSRPEAELPSQEAVCEALGLAPAA